MSTQVEIHDDVVVQMIAERDALYEEMQERGQAEGVEWAQCASYAELADVYRTFSQKYEDGEGSEVYFAFGLVGDADYGDYWRNVFDRNPDVKGTSQNSCFCGPDFIEY